MSINLLWLGPRRSRNLTCRRRRMRIESPSTCQLWVVIPCQYWNKRRLSASNATSKSHSQSTYTLSYMSEHTYYCDWYMSAELKSTSPRSDNGAARHSPPFLFPTKGTYYASVFPFKLCRLLFETKRDHILYRTGSSSSFRRHTTVRGRRTLFTPATSRTISPLRFESFRTGLPQFGWLHYIVVLYSFFHCLR